ncbi:MAG TPA: type IV secretory system conjugative DNA transfer family protein [Acidimicrobiales bacterium]|nr:type IV secretory system conjugative DNA transfer family protein [Acidimicrobiales bacterium]
MTAPYAPAARDGAGAHRAPGVDGAPFAGTERSVNGAPRADDAPPVGDVLHAIAGASASAGYGLYLGAGTSGPVWAPPEQAVLVLGPPRSGKTTALVVPAVLGAQGPVVSTSTKPDVLNLTATARQRKGPCLVYDPSGTVDVPSGVALTRWSPVTRCTRWDDALMVSERLVSSVRPGHGPRTDSIDHWTERAQALLAPLLHAAALEEIEMAGVLRWVDRRESSHAMAILERAGSEAPADQLAGIALTEARELSGIWSTASSVLSAYRSAAALATTVAPDFDAREFCDSGGTLYVCATGSRQALAAPLVVSLISEIRDAAYTRSAERASIQGAAHSRMPQRSPPLVLALDEVANIAPLADLPSIVSEGGSQGVITLACLQDLSQARERWGRMAEGFLSLFGTTIVLPGIGDVRTLETLSTLAGEREVQTRSVSAPVPSSRGAIARAVVRRIVRGPGSLPTDRVPTVTFSTVNRPRLAPDVAARGEPGTALMVDERNRMSWIRLTRCHESRPWCWVVGSPEPGRRSGAAERSEVERGPAVRGLSHGLRPELPGEGMELGR